MSLLLGPRAVWGTAALALFLAGCAASAPLRYYLLPALAESEAGPRSDLRLGVGPVRLPEYLERPQMVALGRDHELRVDDDHRWAEPLRDNVARVLAENLVRLLGTERVLAHPWRQPVDLQVAVELLRFEAGPDGAVELAARWVLSAPEGDAEALIRRSEISEAVTDPGREAVVAAKGRALARLSREIAGAVQAFPPGR